MKSISNERSVPSATHVVINDYVTKTVREALNKSLKPSTTVTAPSLGQIQNIVESQLRNRVAEKVILGHSDVVVAQGHDAITVDYDFKPIFPMNIIKVKLAISEDKDGNITLTAEEQFVQYIENKPW